MHCYCTNIAPVAPLSQIYRSAIISHLHLLQSIQSNFALYMYFCCMAIVNTASLLHLYHTTVALHSQRNLTLQTRWLSPNERCLRLNPTYILFSILPHYHITITLKSYLCCSSVASLLQINWRTQCYHIIIAPVAPLLQIYRSAIISYLHLLQSIRSTIALFMHFCCTAIVRLSQYIRNEILLTKQDDYHSENGQTPSHPCSPGHRTCVTPALAILLQPPEIGFEITDFS